MKIIFKIHPFFYLFAFLCILTGYLKNLCIITFIVLFHECGHILAGIYFKWKIEKVIILPFGGITIFKEKLNRPMIEEFIIAIMGPLFQICLFVFFKSKLFINYNILLLIFNLLPIFPLDGSKLFNIFLNILFSFKKSHQISIIVSLLFIIILFKTPNLIFIIALICLFIKTCKEIKYHSYYFSKFLLERYLYHFDFKKSKKIKKITSMKRDYKHIILFKNHYVTERFYLKELFDKQGFL